MNKSKKRMISLLLVVSCIATVLAKTNVEAASIKYIDGWIDTHMPKRMHVKMTNKSITVSGHYGVGKSGMKAYNAICKRPKRTFKVAAACTVQSGDDVLEIMQYDNYLNYGKREIFLGPCLRLKIKNGKVTKIISYS